MEQRGRISRTIRTRRNEERHNPSLETGRSRIASTLRTPLSMAPRKADAPPPKPPTSTTRRSARLQGAAANPVQDGNRISKVKSAPKPKPKKIDCTTCGRKLAPSSFPDYLPTDNCKHLINTCKACTQTYIALQLDNTTYDRLACPECPELMANADVERLAAKKVYERFDELERRGIAEKVPGWRWCLSSKCRAGQSSVSKDDICICDTCGAKACVPCDRPYHDGETCTQYQERTQQEDEKATAEKIAEVCKQCPKRRKNIEKNGGCDAVQCECHFSIDPVHLDIVR